MKGVHCGNFISPTRLLHEYHQVTWSDAREGETGRYLTVLLPRQSIEVEFVSIQAPHFSYTKRGVNAEPVHRTPRDVNFNCQIGRWMDRQMELLHTENFGGIREPEALVGFQPFFIRFRLIVAEPPLRIWNLNSRARTAIIWARKAESPSCSWLVTMISRSPRS